MSTRLAKIALSAVIALVLATSAALPVASAQPAPPASATAQPVAQPDPSQTPAAPAPAPSAPTDTQRVRTSESIDQAKSRLDQVTAALRRPSLDDAALTSLRETLVPAADQLKQAIEVLVPRLADAKERLDKIGPKPDEKAPPESPQVTAERSDQQQRYARAEELLKRAQLLAVQVDQTSKTIVSRRRTIFVASLFQRSNSIVSPTLWSAVAAELPFNMRAVRYVGSDFVSSLPARLEGWSLAIFLSLVALIALLNIPLYLLVKRILSREPSVADPSRLNKALAAAWVAIVSSIAPIVTILVLFALSDTFEVSSLRLAPLKRSLVDAVARIALVAGLARGLLATARPNWRLIAMPDDTAEQLSRVAVSAAVIVSIAKIVDSMNEIIGASLPVTAATQGVGALIFAFVIGAAIFKLGKNDGDAAEEDECLGPRVSETPRWSGLLRLAAWIALASIVGATLIGFIPFAAFIVDQCVWIAIVCAFLWIFIPLVTESIEAGLQPTTRLGRTLVTSVGVRREGLTQFGIVLAGIAQVLLLAFGLFAIVAPWGLQSDDLVGGLRTAFFGFKVGEVTISPSSMVVALVLFGVVFAATRAVQGWLDQRLMPATSLDAGLRNSIRTSIGYLGFVIAAAIGAAHIGLSLEKVALVAGALSVGIGLGLQSVVNNFVSGLILLWERAIRVGDLVVVGDEQGFVRKINVRSTEIETADRATMIVPNSNIMSGVVKNWVRNDRVGRIRIPVTLNTGVDPERVREIMTGAAKAHDNVAKIPAPATMFIAMEPSGLKFELICFVDDVEIGARVKSDLHYEIFKAFGEAGMSIGSPSSVNVTLQGDAAAVLAKAIQSTQ